MIAGTLKAPRALSVKLQKSHWTREPDGLALDEREPPEKWPRGASGARGRARRVRAHRTRPAGSRRRASDHGASTLLRHAPARAARAAPRRIPHPSPARAPSAAPLPPARTPHSCLPVALDFSTETICTNSLRLPLRYSATRPLRAPHMLLRCRRRRFAI